MAHVLIASLGDSPIVVTSMVNLLQQGVPEQEIDPVPIERVLVLYPRDQPHIRDGLEMIQTYCCCQHVEPCGLPFDDTRSFNDGLTFLRQVQDVLQQTQKAHDEVYLSVAGGRKGMSALLAILGFFYDHIQGVFHVLDKYEDIQERKNFHSLDELVSFYLKDDPRLPGLMNPATENLELIQLPYEHLADAHNLRTWLWNEDPEAEVPVHLERVAPEDLGFWRMLFQKAGSSERLNTIRLSPTAQKQLSHKERQFQPYFTMSKLQNPQWARKRSRKNGGCHLTWKGADNTMFHIAKIGNCAERVLWYQDTQHVVCAELAIEQDGKKYIPINSNTAIDKDYCAQKSAADYPPKFPAALTTPSDDAILIAPVGKSPMVVTQAYTLLQQQGVNISQVALVFPRQNGTIMKGIRLLREVFATKDIALLEHPVPTPDANSTETCRTFFQQIVESIAHLRKQFPAADLRMLLSGGRKGMSALALLAAQHTHISHVYHTLICDPDLENRIEHECAIEQLLILPGTPQRVERMFLERYPSEQCIVFEIPVISLAPGSQ